ncbi:hypothetical protein E2P63_03875 [Candidatus Bathyarchaeota archaeon]|nr:hypothetical protein E2P63_03875 [Candidatus Bathyarchaeota archaeon]
MNKSETFNDFHLVYIDENITYIVYKGYYLYNFKTKRWYSLDLGGSVLKKVGKKTSNYLTEKFKKDYGE